jgi:iron complex outermembrane receptor protein
LVHEVCTPRPPRTNPGSPHIGAISAPSQRGLRINFAGTESAEVPMKKTRHVHRPIAPAAAALFVAAALPAWRRVAAHRDHRLGDQAHRCRTALPVQVIKREDIERTGATSVVELMQNLAVVQGGVVEGDTIGGGGGGQATVSIHNLGGDRTLVLLNGRRLIGEAGGAVDLNMIPLASSSASRC